VYSTDDEHHPHVHVYVFLRFFVLLKSVFSWLLLCILILCVQFAVLVDDFVGRCWGGSSHRTGGHAAIVRKCFRRIADDARMGKEMFTAHIYTHQSFSGVTLQAFPHTIIWKVSL